MSEVQALEAHLRAQPDDWPSWLVYADWLTDQGDVRGELIMLEHRLQAGPPLVPRLSPEERSALQARVAELVAAHQPQWLEGLGRPRGAELSWRRGFVVSVDLLWTAQGLEWLDRLGAHPVGRFLSTLRLRGDAAGVRKMTALTRLRTASALTELDLEGCNISARGARVLAQPALPVPFARLATLKLRNNHLGPSGARLIAQSEALPSLSVLDLAQNELGDAGAVALSQTALLRRLTSLDLGFNDIGFEGAQALAAASSSLKWLSLSGNHLGNRGAAALARSQGLSSLTTLDLTHSRIGLQGREALFRSETLRGCQVLVFPSPK